MQLPVNSRLTNGGSLFCLVLALAQTATQWAARLKDRRLLCSLAGLLAGFVQTGDIWVYEAGRKRIESFRCHATELITTERVQNSPNPSRQMCPTRVIACTNPTVGSGQWRHLDYLDVSAEAAELDRNLRCSTPRVRDEEKKLVVANRLKSLGLVERERRVPRLGVKKL